MPRRVLATLAVVAQSGWTADASDASGIRAVGANAIVGAPPAALSADAKTKRRLGHHRHDKDEGQRQLQDALTTPPTEIPGDEDGEALGLGAAEFPGDEEAPSDEETLAGAAGVLALEVTEKLEANATLTPEEKANLGESVEELEEAVEHLEESEEMLGSMEEAEVPPGEVPGAEFASDPEDASSATGPTAVASGTAAVVNETDALGPPEGLPADVAAEAPPGGDEGDQLDLPPPGGEGEPVDYGPHCRRWSGGGSASCAGGARRLCAVF